MHDILPITPAQFRQAYAQCMERREDRFAGTFIAKANAMNLWGNARGIVGDDGLVMAAIVVRVSKRRPHVANLQLLHTFSQHRRHGLGRQLVEHEFDRVARLRLDDGEYVHHFRVSSEPESVEFYRALGFRFWGRQKSGSLLSVFRIGGTGIGDGIYNWEDPVVDAAVNSGRRGGVVEMLEGAPC